MKWCLLLIVISFSCSKQVIYKFEIPDEAKNKNYNEIDECQIAYISDLIDQGVTCVFTSLTQEVPWIFFLSII
jgi:hypothetical protein